LILLPEAFINVKKYTFDRDIESILDFLDGKLYNVKQKKSDQYKIFEILKRVVLNFEKWEDESNVLETTYLRKFEELTNVLFRGSEVILSDDEGISTCTRNDQILYDANIDTGLKIDRLVKVPGGDNLY
jgi:hypothetical protein